MLTKRTHSPYFDQVRPVFPDAPEVPSPFYLHQVEDWRWDVTVSACTLQYFVAANASYEFDGEVYPISRGSCFLFRPGDRVKGVALDDAPTTVFAAHFEAFPDSFPKNAILATSIVELGLFESVVEHAVRERRRDGTLAAKQVQSALETLYYLFCANYSRPTVTAVQRKVERLLDSINAEVTRDWSVDVMCSETGLSRSQLNRWFNTLTGMSPNRYVIHQRVGKAVQLIGLTDRSLEEIALMLGYRDVYFFSRQFKKVMGYPPSKLRKV